jgi:hypothetical protein
MLTYPKAETAEASEFADGVMRAVGRERRTRRLILFAFGLVGALFGLAGAFMLSDSIVRLFTETLTGDRVMQLVLFTIAAMAFYTWFMNDDLTLDK